MRRATLLCAVGAAASVAAIALFACGIKVEGTYVPPEGGSSSPTFTFEGGRSPDPAELDGGVEAGGPAGCGQHPGPQMIAAGTYCIDATEVTELQYAAFLNTTQKIVPIEACKWKASNVPSAQPPINCRWDANKYPNLPVVCVDWCDADAYCRWAGKQLCGAIAGGATPWAPGPDVNPGVDAWYRACSSAGLNDFPYGPLFRRDACNGAERRPQILNVIDVATSPECAGGLPGLYDMVGNAFEWENSCETNAESARCKLRGGSWSHTTDQFNTCSKTGINDVRSARHDDTGFRCCSL